MTGEITLRGEVLPIGAEGEAAGAHRAASRRAHPDENVKDLVEIPDNIKGNLEIKPVKWIDEGPRVPLTEQPRPHQQADAPVATR